MVTSDIPGAFLQTNDTRGITNMNFYGIMAELLANIDTDLYIKYTITDDKGCNMIYAE